MVNVTVEQMLEAGLHFGHQTFRWNPKMRPFIFDARDGIYIIDLVKTHEKLKEATDFVAGLAKEGSNFLLVGTKRQAGPIIEEVAKAAGLPYVSAHWPGGLLTNFRTIKSRISYLKELREKFAAKDFGDMTKKEIGLLAKELVSLEEAFGGVDTLDSLPGAIFVVDVLQEKIALKEAIKLGIPIIAMVDTNGDPSGIEFVIPANDDAKNGILLVTRALVDSFVKNRRVAAAKASKAEVSEEELIPPSEILEQKEVKIAEAKQEEATAEAEKREKRATTKRKG